MIVEDNDDLLMYWGDCYFISPHEEPVKLRERDEDGFLFYNPETGEEEFCYDLLEPLSFVSGYRDYKGSVVYVSLFRGRSYKKGITDNKVVLSFPQKEELYTIDSSVLGLKVYEVLLPQKKFKTVEEAVNLLNSNKKYAVSLSNSYALCKKLGKEGYVLYNKKKPVGFIDKSYKVSFIDENLKYKFKGEVPSWRE